MRKEKAMSLEKAIQRAFERVTARGDEVDIYEILYSYKAIRDLPEEQIDEIYDNIAARQGFTKTERR